MKNTEGIDGLSKNKMRKYKRQRAESDNIDGEGGQGEENIEDEN